MFTYSTGSFLQSHNSVASYSKLLRPWNNVIEILFSFSLSFSFSSSQKTPFAISLSTATRIKHRNKKN
ncbi:hypothetical protein L1887_16160 [Cichorium endivia]|nr:hypothetical protein L1887_16160 [Cichorium endivia]